MNTVSWMGSVIANAFPMNSQSTAVTVIVTVDFEVRTMVQSTPVHTEVLTHSYRLGFHVRGTRAIRGGKRDGEVGGS